MTDALSTFDTWQMVALAAALGWASGVRLYAVLFIVGGLGYLGVVNLPHGLALLEHPWVLAASGFMFCVEFFADKIPGVDTVWDFVHTFIRIPAGAALAVGTVLWLAFAHPIAALVVLLCLVAFTIWLIPKIWRFIRKLFGRLTGGASGAPSR